MRTQGQKLALAKDEIDVGYMIGPLMAEQTGEEAKEKNIKAMGQTLGVQYTQLWQEIAHMNIMWKEFIELFGSKLSRIELLNRSAGAFFSMVQDGIETCKRHLCRLVHNPE
jgi:hypothetical protein